MSVRGVGQRDVALFGAFAVDLEVAALQVEVVVGEAAKLGQADAGVAEAGEHGVVEPGTDPRGLVARFGSLRGPGKWCREEFVEVVCGVVGGGGRGLCGRPDAGGGVDGRGAVAVEVFVEGSERVHGEPP